MLAMQLTIRLGVVCDSATVHALIAERVQRLSRRDLIHAFCLVNEDEHVYAPLYVWRTDGAMRGFLLGSLMTGVVETFGRPKVRTWSVLEFGEADTTVVPRHAVREIDALRAEHSPALAARREGKRHRDMLGLPGLHAHVVMLDPERWEIARFSLWRDHGCAPTPDSDCVHTYRVAQFSEPVGATT